MAFTAVGTLGTGVSSTAAASFTLTTATNALASGEYGILTVVTDNIATVDGNTSNHTSVTGGTGTWTKLGEYTNTVGGAAGDGVTTSVWLFKASGTNAIGTVMTMNTSASTTDKAASFYKFTAPNNVVAVSGVTNPVTNGVDGVNGFGSVAFSGLTSQEYLFFRGLGKEANSTTGLTVSSGFTAIANTRSRNNASAVGVWGEFDILTGTGVTSNPTLAVTGDTAGVFVALREAVQSLFAATPSSTATVAGALTTSIRMAGAASSAATVSATLTVAPIATLDFVKPAQWGMIGPFVASSGAKYVLGRDSVDPQRVVVLKTTSSSYTTLSNWSEVARTTSPVVGANGASSNDFVHQVVQQGDKLHLVTNNERATGWYAYHQFNMATDTWDVLNETVDSDATFNADSTWRQGAGLTVRSTGEVVICYVVYNSTKVGWYYSRRTSGGSWTRGVALSTGGNSFNGGHAQLGTSDRVHFFINDQSSAYERTLSSSNVLEGSAPQTIVSSGAIYPAATALAGSEVRVLLRDLFSSIGSTLRTYRFTSADTPSGFTVNNVATLVGEPRAPLLISDGTAFHVVFSDSGSTPADYPSYAAASQGGAWSTPATVPPSQAQRAQSLSVYARGAETVLGQFSGLSNVDAYVERNLTLAGSASSAATVSGTLAPTGARAFTNTLSEYLWNSNTPNLGSGDWTVGIWAKWGGTQYSAPFQIGTDTGADSVIITVGGSSGEWTPYAVGVGSFSGTTTTKAVAGTWQFVAIRYIASTKTLYLIVDGTQDANTVTGTGSTVPATNRTIIGARASGTGNPAGLLSQHWDGSLGDFAVWNRAVSNSELSSMATNKLSPLCYSDGLVEHYPIRGVVSPEVSSLNANRLTLVGTTAANGPGLRTPPLLSGADHATTVLGHSPAVYLRLKETVGASTAVDSSGNGKDFTVGTGVVTGASTLLPDPNEKAYTQSTSSGASSGASYALSRTSDSTLPTSGAFSFATIVRPTTASGTLLLQGTHPNATQFGFRSYGNPTAFYYFDTTNGYVDTSTVYAPNTTYHAAVTRSSSGLVKIFVNGTKVKEQQLGSAAPTPSVPDQISFFGGTSSSDNILGTWEEAAYWTSELTEAQIAAQAGYVGGAFGVATASGSMGGPAALFAGALAGAATVVGALTTAITAAGALAASANTTAALTTAISCAGALNATATTAAALTTQITAAGALTSSGLVTGSLTTAITLAAGITGTATVSGTMAGASALFEGALTSTATLTGALTTAITLAAAVTGAGTVTGALTTAITAAASVTGAATVTGSLATAIRLATAVSGTATVVGALTTAIRLTGSLAASAAAEGSLNAGSGYAPNVLFFAGD